MKDLWAALRSSWYYFRRELRRRRAASAKRAMPDPLSLPRFEFGEFLNKGKGQQ
jgi:hypothetical protein